MPSISKAIAAMDKACRVWSVGYDQYQRWNIYNGGETDCSALVIWALKQGGFDTGSATYTGNLSANLTSRGWRRIAPDLGILQPGDILLNDTHHVCMVISGHGRNAIIAQASIDERGRATGGRAGDQTGYETNERRAYQYHPDQSSSGSLGLQGILGTTADGIVSSQEVQNRGILKACTGGWQWVKHPEGSQLITKMQKIMKLDPDGIAGIDFVHGLEKRYGFEPDKGLDYPSNTIKKMQQAINKGTF